MAYFDHLDTEKFSEVEIAARAAAQEVERLKVLLKQSRDAALLNWVGDGRGAFESLFHVVDQQIEDISKEFWDLFDAVCDAEGSYIEADQEVATAIASGE